MLVFRVATGHDQGLYRGDNGNNMTGYADNLDKHPLPNEDAKIGDMKWRDYLCTANADYMRFGFPSIKALRKWIDSKSRQRYHNDKFKVFIYQGEQNLLVGETQVVYDTRYVTQIGEPISLLEV